MNEERYDDVSLTLHFKSNKLDDNTISLAISQNDREQFQLRIFLGTKTIVENVTEVTFMIDRLVVEYVRDITRDLSFAQKMTWNQIVEAIRNSLI